MRVSCVRRCVLLLLAACSGCVQQQATEVNPLVFSQRRTQLVITDTTVDTNEISHSFEFDVWDRQPVTIKSIATSCKCIRTDTDLIGKLLEPKSRQVVRMRVNPQGRSGRFTAMAFVETEPATTRPIVLSAELLIASRPTVSPDPLVVDRTFGKPAEAAIRVVRVREVSVPALELNIEESDFGPFTLTGQQVKHGELPLDEAQGATTIGVSDELALSLHSSHDLSIGEHPFAISLKWNNKLPPTEVSGTMRVLHPVHPQLQRIFCQVATGEQKRLELRLLASDSSKYQVESVMCDLTGLIAEMNEARDGLICTVQPQSMPGRLSGTVTVTFNEGSAPPLQIPVGLLIVPAQSER